MINNNMSMLITITIIIITLISELVKINYGKDIKQI